MPDIYKLNDVEVQICSVLPSEKGDRDWTKYVKIYEPSQRLGHSGRFLIIRKHKLETVEATSPLERMQ